MPRDGFHGVVSIPVTLAMCALVSGCAVAPSAEVVPKKQAAEARDAELASAQRARAVHALSLAMADRWADALGAARAAITKDASPASRGAVQMALSEASGAALAIGSDADAGAAVLDLLVQSSLQNWLFTANPRGAGVDRAEAERALGVLAPARTDLWSMASREFDAQTLADLRILVDAWVKARGDDARVSHVRLADLASPAGGLGAAERERAAAILAAASARARGVDAGALLGERMLWYLSRYPALLGTQAEATAARIADAAERSGRSDRAAFADTLAKERVAFGEILADERKALAAAATTERKAIAGSLGEERAALADALAKERAALADALGKHRDASFADLAREREALVSGVKDAVASSGATAASEREAFATWAAEERAAFADDLEARLVKLVDRALVGAGIVAGALLVGLAILKFIPSRKAG